MAIEQNLNIIRKYRQQHVIIISQSAKGGLALQESTWYKDAVLYQVHIRSFADSNKDGIGDFPGLTEKLDYIVNLGVTAIWLLPFYPSPRLTI